LQFIQGEKQLDTELFLRRIPYIFAIQWEVGKGQGIGARDREVELLELWWWLFFEIVCDQSK